LKINLLKRILIIVLAYTLLNIIPAMAKEFYFKFNQKESLITFDISTSVHPVRAIAKKFRGFMRVKTADEKKFDEIEALLEIDTGSITTQIGLCNEIMRRDTLKVETYPKITFKVKSLEITSNKTGSNNIIFLKLGGFLTIRGVEQEVAIPVKVTVSPDKTFGLVEGKYSINFNDFKVPDPSIFIAKVYPVLDLSFKLKVFYTK
jgi:polyisoprenoid-binding protein YceI